MEIEKHIIKPYTMNGGGFRYIGQEKVPTICAMYHNVFSTFPEKPYIMEIDKNIDAMTTVQKDNMIMERKPIQLNHSDKEFGKQPQQQNRVYDEEGISPAIMANMSCGSHAVFSRCRIRRLTPTECARLQTIPDWYEWKGKFPDGKVKPTSDTQIYKMCGNGWNVEVIKHIFSFLPFCREQHSILKYHI